MSYYGSSIPDWGGYLLSLKETLEDILFGLEEDDKAQIRTDISYLEAVDRLNQYLETVKSDLGV